MNVDGGYRVQPVPSSHGPKDRTHRHKPRRRKRKAFLIAACLAFLALVAVAATAWLAVKAATAKDELNMAASLLPQLKDEVMRRDAAAAGRTVETLRGHTTNAREATADPLWRLAAALPGVGPNLRAASEVATTADDVATLGAAPLVGVLESLDWKSLAPSEGGVDVRPLASASPAIESASNAVAQSSERLDAIDSANLLPQISEPLRQARSELGSLRMGLRTAADFAALAPAMFGTESPRHYLLLVENNAEVRATGGIPGALAVLSVDEGHLSLGSQSSATRLGSFTPPVEMYPEQQNIYSTRLGKFMQDANLTPDFPSTAEIAQAMWEREFGQRVDGVISIDPIALSYVLDATGPVKLTDPQLVATAGESLPVELTSKNVVQTLLSDVYKEIAQPELQDIYLAGVAKEVFSALASGVGDDKLLLDGLAKGIAERRVLLWSSSPEEQAVIGRYPASGSISGPAVAPAEFGLYFNDGTGAKMDFYVKRTVQLIKECPRNGYEQITVRVTSTNTAPAEASTVLPRYVTGDGVIGVPIGSVQTNIVAYGPVQANVETVTLDGQKTEFAPYFHSDRPVGVLALRLAPGESKTVDFTFGKIVQHTEPNLVVTPTVQPVKDVTLPTENASCG
ncbi:hypothetical protein QF038_000810 [Pseudarthrobacter sp. W1I19]|uniref:DUF4012 domain-containing protein n=1 Tax=Pseudarthrobacter sp. W1I19 TaxID=3042288 RepID=UPI00277DB29B|nr:DUF4012 domain-containing protein [Pseudarthrobacter sp. W1I19]MDQ0922302.1 hypothetical protein [Pseudarthrobacter sp. W1I19]